MEHRHVGRSGLQVSVLELGANNFGVKCNAEQTARVIYQALDLGINHIDTANTYGGVGRSEEFIGAALKGRRQEAVLASKVGMPIGQGPYQKGASRRHIMEQVEGSLRRLGMDYIDLYYIHTPDPDTPIEETLRALDDLVRQGKVRYIGCSNFSAWQTCEAVWTSRLLGLASFIVVQLEYSLVNRDIERETASFCQQYGLGIVPYSPLGGGLLTGKYKAGEPAPPDTRFATTSRGRDKFLTERNLALVAKLEPFSKDRGHTVGEVAIAWLLGNPLVCSVIAGATRPEQMVENAKGAEWHLTAQDREAVRALLDGEPEQ